MRKSLLLSLIILTSCADKNSIDLNDLEGYWEIYQVEKEGEIVKEFKISANIDYFKINTDSIGFRKKVAPQLDGTYVVSKIVSNFKIYTSEDNSILIKYTNKNFNTDEVIKELSKSNLAILNSEGNLYKYKRFEKFDLINE